jgi:hypothetical protein
MADLNYYGAFRGGAASREFILASSQMTAERAGECAQRFHPLVDFLQLRLKQIPHLAALTGAAAGLQRSNIIE